MFGFLLPSRPLSQYPIRARGIIVKYLNGYLFIQINRQSIHPKDAYVHKEADDFTPEDLEDIILFLGLNYIFTKIPAFLITKLDGLLFRSAGRGILA